MPLGSLLTLQAALVGPTRWDDVTTLKGLRKEQPPSMEKTNHYKGGAMLSLRTNADPEQKHPWPTPGFHT